MRSKRLSSLLSSNVERFILFASGVLLSALVSGLLAETISWSVAVLVLMTVLLVVTVIYFLSDSFGKLNRLIERTEITAEYITEPYVKASSYTGIIYKRLKDLIDRSEQEILYLSTGGQSEVKPWEEVMQHPTRITFLKAIEDKVSQQRDKDFKYILVRQVEEGSSVAFSPALIEHCHYILDLKTQLTHSHNTTVDLLKVSPQRMNSFLIVDGKYLAIFLYSDLHAEVAIYASGVLLIEDRGGRMLEKMKWYFDYLERSGKLVKKSEL